MKSDKKQFTRDILSIIADDGLEAAKAFAVISGTEKGFNFTSPQQSIDELWLGRKKFLTSDTNLMKKCLGSENFPFREQVDRTTRQLLVQALMSRNSRLASRLIEAGTELNFCPSSQATPMMLAAKNGDVANLTLMLSLGAKIDCANESGVTPLHFAANYRQASAFEFLLDNGADPLLRSASDQGTLCFLTPYAHRDVIYEHLGALARIAPDKLKECIEHSIRRIDRLAKSLDRSGREMLSSKGRELSAYRACRKLLMNFEPSK